MRTWCRAASGWVTGGAQGTPVVEHPGVGGEENFTKATKWWNKNQNRKIVRISRNDVNNAGCTVYDFNIASVKNKHLTSNKAKNYARASCEVVLKCSRHLNCAYV